MNVMRILLILTALVFPVLAEATTYYVDTNGSDSNNGSSEDTPFRQPRKCITILVAGDTCLIKNGTYQEPSVILLARSGTQTSPIIIKNYPGHAPVINWIGDTVTTPIYSRILLQSAPRSVPIQWITIEGLTFTSGVSGIRWYNCQNCTIRKNTFVDHYGSAIYGTGALDTVIEDNVVISAGDDAVGGHGFYLNGSRYTIRHNVIYDTRHYGVQLKGTADPNDTINYAGPEFAKSENAIITNNTFAYNRVGPALVMWGPWTNNARVENNVFYETDVDGGSVNGVNFITCCAMTGIQIRNNLSYVTGVSGTTMIDPEPTEGVNYTQSNNYTQVNPGFVSAPADYGGPGSPPDFTLSSAASGAIGKARANEFPQQSTLAVGAFGSVPAPTATITANKITLTFPMGANTPIQSISTTGVSVACSGHASCPGSPTVTAAARKTGTETQVEITIGGITGNACELTQTWTISYNAAIGSWTDSARIGAYPGQNQKVFSFANLATTNKCTGGGTPPPPTDPYIAYAFDEGTGTTADNTGTFGASGDGTLANGAGWGTGKSGTALSIASGTTQQLDIPYGSGVNPTSQSLTISFGIFIPVGTTQATIYPWGSPHGTDQRNYICALSGTWRVSTQAVRCSTSGASNLTVDEGWNFLSVVYNATTDTVTLYKNGVVGTGGATRAITSYTFAGNFNLGRVPDTGNAAEGRFDFFSVYLGVADVAALYDAFNQTNPPVLSGTFIQNAVQAQSIYLTAIGGNPINNGTLQAARNVVADGSIAWIFQIECETDDCDATAFRLAYRKNGTGSWLAVPDIENADGIRMFGPALDALLNVGATSTRLSGSCTVTNGETLLTSAQAPSVDLPNGGCVMLRYIVSVTDVAGAYFELRVEREGGTAFAGAYTLARIDVIAPQATGGF